MAKKVIIQGRNLLQSLNDKWGDINNTEETIIPYQDRGGTTEVPPGQEWGMNRGEVERFLKEVLRVQGNDLDTIAAAIETLRNAAIGDVQEGPINPVTNKKPIYFYKVGNTTHETPDFTIEVIASVGGEEKTPRITVTRNTPNVIKKGDIIDFDWLYKFIHKIDGEEQQGGVRPTPSSVSIEAKVGNTVIYSETVNGGVEENHAYNVRFSNPTVTGLVTITVEATVIVDGEVVVTRGGETVTIVEMNLSTSFTPDRSLSNGGIEPNEVEIGCSYNVPQSTDLYVYLDYEALGEPLTISGRNTYFLTSGILSQNHNITLAPGKHNVQFVAENGGLLSNVLVVEFLVKGGNEDYLGMVYSTDISSLDEMPLPYRYGELDWSSYPAKVERFSDLEIKFAAWNASSNESEVNVFLGYQYDPEFPAQTLTVNRALQTLRQRFNEQETSIMTIVMGNASPIHFYVQVMASDALEGIEIAPNPYKELLAEGHSNTMANPDDWGGITTFYDVNWNTNGWYTDANGITYLLLTNGARAVIDMRAFTAGENGPQMMGMVLQMKFRISHVTERGATVISCLSTNTGQEGWPTGFRITTEEAGLLLGGKEDIATTEKRTYNGIHDGVEMESYIDDFGVEVHIGDYIDANGNKTDKDHAATLMIERPFGVTMDIAVDKWIDLFFVIQAPSAATNNYGIAMLYINGVLSRVNRFHNSHSITQDAPMPIIIDSDKANVNMRLIRWYRRYLKADNVLDNAILGLDTQGDMVEAIERNAVGDPNTQDDDENMAISREVLGTKRKGRLTIIKNTSDNGGEASIEELFGDGVSKKTNFRAELVKWEPPLDDNGNPIGDGFEARGVRIRIQGTSSVNYPYKNIRVYLTTPFSKNDGMSFSSGGKTYTWVNDELVDENNKKCKGYALRGSELSRPQKVLCAKTDFVDSSLVMNTGGAHLFNDVMKALDLKTPPMEHDSRVRQAIDGIPCDLFAATSEDVIPQYYGQFVLNNEKSKSGGIFGMEGNDDAVFVPTCPIALESLENKYAFTLFQAAGSANSQDLEEQMLDSFDSAFEFNFPEDTFYNPANVNPADGQSEATAEQKTAIKRLMGFIHDSVAASSVDMSDPEYGGHEENGGWIAADKQKWVSQYFKNHISEYFDLDYLLTYYVITDYWASVDQRAKNILWRTWDGLKWYPTYYDGDTAMGVRNDAFLVYKYDVTRDTWDAERGKYAFEGHDSWLWCLVLANYENELQTKAQQLRRGGYMSNAAMLHEFNEVMMGNWSERQYNKSGKLKYVDTMFKSSKYYPFTLQGNKELHRTQFIIDRAALLDARYNAGDYGSDVFTIAIERSLSDDPDSLTLVSGDLYYYGWRENDNPRMTPVRVTKGEEYTMLFAQQINGSSTNVRITGASKIKELDLTGLGSHFMRQLQIDKCAMLTKLVIQATNGAASNVNVSVGNVDTLEYVDITGQTNLYTGTSGLLDLSGQSRLETLLASGTNLTTVNLPEGAPITELVLPNTLTMLKLRYLPQLTMEGLTVADSQGNAVQSYTSVIGFNFAVCQHLDWKELFDRCPNVQRVRVEGVTGKVTPEWLQNLKERDVKGFNVNGDPVDYPCLEGTVTLTKVIPDQDLEQLQEHFRRGGLTIVECQYSVYEIDDTITGPACVRNTELGFSEGSMANDAFGTGYVASGHAVKVRDKMKPYFGHLDAQTNKWTGFRISDSNYKKDANGDDYNYSDSLDNSNDLMMLLPHCFYKGVNDFKNQKKYICWSALDETPQSSASQTLKYHLDDAETEAEMLVGTSVGVRLANITVDVSNIGDDGIITSVNMDASALNVYKVNVEGMKQVRWPGIINANYGVCFTDANGIIISKWKLEVADNDFDFQQAEFDYLFLGVPQGAKEFFFTVPKTYANEARCVVVVTDSEEIEAIEPDWVEHKQCLLGVYQAWINTDSSNNVVDFRLRSLTGKACKRGNGTSTTAAWTYNSDGNPTNAPSPLNFTMKDFQNVSRLRGQGYQLVDYEMSKFVALLFYCIHGTLDSQKVCGDGTSGLTSGYADSIGNNSSTGSSNTNGPSNLRLTSGNKCLGLESFFGCYLEWMDNCCVNRTSYGLFYKGAMTSGGSAANGRWSIFNPDSMDEEKERFCTSPNTGNTSSSGGYIKRVRHGRFCDLVPSVVAGSSITRYCDYYYYSTSGRVLARSFNNGYAYAGVAYANASNASSYSYASFGSRLAFRGDIILQEP